MKTVITAGIIVFSLLGLSGRAADLALSEQEQGWLQKAHRQDKNGWIFLHVEGKPFERGFQRGYLTANEINSLFNTLAHVTKYDTGKDIDFFVKKAADLFKKKVSEEYRQEMLGTVAGMVKAGKDITYDQVLLMNGYIDVVGYWWPKEKEELMKKPGPGCSAFVATGDATADGKIVMAHNSWSFFAVWQYGNIILDLVPEKGHRILMQTWGPVVYSASDFFITGAGLVGTETTIDAFEGFEAKGIPIFERARRAMQYANTLDEWAKILIEKNNGAYANSWLLGDLNTNEIAVLELGLKNHRFEKKKNGVYVGSNVTDSLEILRGETKSTYDDVRVSTVARRVRWGQLMKENHGKIDVEIAKKMLADHHDVYLEKAEPSRRTLCGHFELDNGMVPEPVALGAFFPFGAADGKVVDADLARKWSLWAKWGHPCDLEFDAEKFLQKYPQYEWLRGYLPNLPKQPWTLLTGDDKK